MIRSIQINRYILMIIIIGILCLLVTLPLVRLFLVSFTSAKGFGPGNYVNAWRSSAIIALRNSLLISALAAFLGLLLATILTWLVISTDLPFRKVFRTLLTVNYAMPPLLIAISWVLLASPNVGIFNRMINWLTGIEGALNIFSIAGVVFMYMIFTLPFYFIFIANALENVPADLEEAARILGASKGRMLMSITLPLILPALIAAFILAFLESMILFAIPAAIAFPARIPILTTHIWELFIEYPTPLGKVAALAIPLLLVTLLLLAIQRWLLRKKSFTTLTGRTGARKMYLLGSWRWLVFFIVLVVIGISVFLPYAVLTIAALSKTWGLKIGWENLSFNNFKFILLDFQTVRFTLKNSFIFALGTATAVAIFATLIAYLGKRKLVRGYQAISFLTLSPLVVPGIVLAVGIFAAYAGKPFSLYGTPWILLIAYISKNLPLGFMLCQTSMESVDDSLEDSARLLGAKRARAIVDIIIPLIKGGMLSAWIFVFMPTFRELPQSILLFSHKTQPIAVTLFNIYEEGKMECAAVLGLILVLITVLMLVVARRVAGKDILRLE